MLKTEWEGGLRLKVPLLNTLHTVLQWGLNSKVVWTLWDLYSLTTPIIKFTKAESGHIFIGCCIPIGLFCKLYIGTSGPKVIKLFMHKTEHEISTAHKT